MAWLQSQVRAYLKGNLGPGYMMKDDVRAWPMTETAAVELCRIVCLARDVQKSGQGGPGKRRGRPSLPGNEDDDGAYLDRDVSPSLRRYVQGPMRGK